MAAAVVARRRHYVHNGSGRHRNGSRLPVAPLATTISEYQAYQRIARTMSYLGITWALREDYSGRLMVGHPY